MRTFFFITILVIESQLFAQVTKPHIVNFDNHPAGSYTITMAKQDFPDKNQPSASDIWGWYYGMEGSEAKGANRAEIIQNGDGKALRVKYPAGCFGPNEPKDPNKLENNEAPVGCAMQIKWIMPESADTMWVSYNIKFEDGFDFIKGGKLPGLCGGKCHTGGNRPTIVGDGWSARIMWKENGKIIQYMYFIDQAENYGDQMLWDYNGSQKQFITGKWHNVLTQVILNTVPQNSETGDKSGIVRSWLDGELSMEVDTLRLVDFAEQSIDIFSFSTFHGGDNDTWAPKKDSYIVYDDFYISKNPPPNFGEEDEPSSSSSEDKNTPIISQFTDMGSLSVIAVGNNLVFGNLPSNAKIAVYNTHGQKQGTTNLAKGLYLVKVNSTIFKVPVK